LLGVNQTFVMRIDDHIFYRWDIEENKNYLYD